MGVDRVVITKIVAVRAVSFSTGLFCTDFQCAVSYTHLTLPTKRIV